MNLKVLFAAALLAAVPLAAGAHSPKVGYNGGAQSDAGNYHVEVVPDGAVLKVYLRDHADQPVVTQGFTGTAIFVIGGKPQRILLMPAGENQLKGQAAVAIPAVLNGAVQITTPTGSTLQAKFQ